MTENARAAISASRHAVLSTIRDFSTLMVVGLLMIVMGCVHRYGLDFMVIGVLIL